MPLVKMVPLTQIRRDLSIWPRRHLCEALVKEFAELYRHHGPEAVDPILVEPAGPDGMNRLRDGHHRVTGAERAGLTHLPAIIRPVKDDAEAYEEAVRLSARGSLKMTPAEKRDAVDRLLRANPERSDRAIAEIVGVSHPLVARRREAMEQPQEEKAPTERPRAGRHAASLIKAAQALTEAVTIEVGSRAKGEGGELLLTSRLGETLSRAAVKLAEGEAGALLTQLEAGILDARERL
jgi:ParB-like chromosome segregation protein Spo0J